MEIKNLTNRQGNAVKNQFVITDGNRVAFQSYDILICEIENNNITLTKDYNFSQTTAKHRNKFLSDMLGVEIKTADVEKMIKCGKFNSYNVHLLN